MHVTAEKVQTYALQEGTSTVLLATHDPNCKALRNSFSRASFSSMNVVDGLAETETMPRPWVMARNTTRSTLES